MLSKNVSKIAIAAILASTLFEIIYSAFYFWIYYYQPEDSATNSLNIWAIYDNMEIASLLILIIAGITFGIWSHRTMSNSWKLSKIKQLPQPTISPGW